MVLKGKSKIIVRSVCCWNIQNYIVQEAETVADHKLIYENRLYKYLYEMYDMKNFAINACILLSVWADIKSSRLFKQNNFKREAHQQ